MNSLLPLSLIGLGVIVALIGGVWALVVAFQRSIVWGLCCLLIPFASIVFLFVAWEDVRRAFFTQLAGFALILGPVFLLDGGAMDLKNRLQGVVPLEAVAQADPKRAAVDARLAELRQRENALLARKAALNPKDTIEARKLTDEILRYNVDLKAATAERDALAPRAAE